MGEGYSRLSIVLINAKRFTLMYYHLLMFDKVDILAVSETWLDEMIQDEEICPLGYSIVRYDRNKNGGCVLLYLSDRYRYCVCNVEVVKLKVYGLNYFLKVLKEG